MKAIGFCASVILALALASCGVMAPPPPPAPAPSPPPPRPAPSPPPSPSVTVSASRLFATPGSYSPEAFKAFGIIAFKQAATSANEDRYVSICEGFVAGLTSYVVLEEQYGAAPEDQMVTVWPLSAGFPTTDLNYLRDSEQRNLCNDIVADIDLAASLIAIAAAQQVVDAARFSGRGPFLLAWSPAASYGQPGANVVIADLSNVTTTAGATDIFSAWGSTITSRPELWRSGWSLEGLRVSIAQWADMFGPAILSFVTP